MGDRNKKYMIYNNKRIDADGGDDDDDDGKSIILFLHMTYDIHFTF